MSHVRYYLARARKTGRGHVIYYARQPHEKQRGSRHAIDSVQARHPKARANADAVSAAGPPARCCFLGLARSLVRGGRKEKKADCGMTKQILKASNSNSAVPFGGTGQVVDRRRRARTEGGRVGFGIRALAPSVLALQAKHSSMRLSPPEHMLVHSPVFTSCRPFVVRACRKEFVGIIVATKRGWGANRWERPANIDRQSPHRTPR